MGVYIINILNVLVGCCGGKMFGINVGSLRLYVIGRDWPIWTYHSHIGDVTLRHRTCVIQ